MQDTQHTIWCCLIAIHSHAKPIDMHDQQQIGAEFPIEQKVFHILKQTNQNSSAYKFE